MSSELTFRDRFKAVAGEHPHAWGSSKGLDKAFVANCLRGTGRPQRRNLDKLVKATGIDEEWWLNGSLPPPTPRTLMKSLGVPAGAGGFRYVAMATEAGPDDGFGEISQALLDGCLQACAAVHGAGFAALPVVEQLGYAGHLYNLVVRMARQTGRSPRDALRLEPSGLADQLRLFKKMGWSKVFPPPPLVPEAFF